MQVKDDTYWKCQMNMLDAYKNCSNRYYTQYENLASLVHLGDDSDCTERFPQLKVIMTRLRLAEEKSQIEMERNPFGHDLPDGDICRTLLAKFEEKEVARSVLKIYNPIPDLEEMFDWRIRYEIWHKKHQTTITFSAAYFISGSVAYVIASNRYSPMRKIATYAAILTSAFILARTTNGRWTYL